MACILILEDDEISARLATRMLKTHGHEVYAVAKSDAAWVRLQESAIDVLLLDTELDGEHGHDVLAGIRSDALFRDLTVVVFSGISRRDIVQHYLTLGVQGMLVKPSSAERLNQEIDRVTAKIWRKKLFEPEEAVQLRTGLMPVELQRLYQEAAEELRGAIPELNTLVDDLTHGPGLARLAMLRSCSINIGYLRLTQMVERMQAAVAAGDAEALKRVVERLPAALRMLVVQAGGDLPVEANADSGDGTDSGT
jgi:CheY-like chemotaxis protein